MRLLHVWPLVASGQQPLELGSFETYILRFVDKIRTILAKNLEIVRSVMSTKCCQTYRLVIKEHPAFVPIFRILYDPIENQNQLCRLFEMRSSMDRPGLHNMLQRVSISASYRRQILSFHLHEV